MAGLFDDLMSSGKESEPLKLTVRPLDPRSRDLAIRTIYGEAANEPEEGLAGVAAVIRNRMQAGRYGGSDVESVVRAPNQFEPWNTGGGQMRMRSLRPDDPKYERIGNIVEKIFSGQMPDPTNGATHFFAPRAQAALGRNVPAWAQGEGLPIGGHTFYAPEGRVQVASGAPAMQGQPTQTNAPVTRAGLFDDLISPLPSSTGLPGGLPPRAGREGVAPLAETVPAAPPAAPTSPAQRLAVDFQNQGSAAGQGTSPNVGLQSQNLISDQVHQSDSGELLYRDPATGQMVPTDQNKHVVLRDPADNTLKVFGRTADTDEGRLSAGGRLLMTGAASGAPTVRPAVPLSSARAPSAEALKDAAKAGYKSPDVAAVTIAPDALTSWSQTTRAGLNKSGLDENLAPKTFSILAKTESAPEGAVVTVDNLRSLRRTLGNAASSIEPTERLAAKTAMTAVDELLANLPKGQTLTGDPQKASAILSEANQNYAAAKRSEQIGTAQGRAQLAAESAGSGANIDNTTRQQIKTILNNPKLLRGFSGEEIRQMRAIVRGTFTGNAARLVGKLAPTGAVSAPVSIGLGFLGGDVTGAIALPMVGFAAKKLGDLLTGRQVAKLDEMLRSRAPLAKAVENSSTRWAEKAEAFAAAPSGPTYAAVALASRNLANNLASLGFEVSPRELLRSLQGTVAPRAEGDQKN